MVHGYDEIMMSLWTEFSLGYWAKKKKKIESMKKIGVYFLNWFSLRFHEIMYAKKSQRTQQISFVFPSTKNCKESH